MSIIYETIKKHVKGEILCWIINMDSYLYMGATVTWPSSFMSLFLFLGQESASKEGYSENDP